MTNSVALKKRIKDSGLRIYFIAAALGLSYPGLQNKIRNETEFKASEIEKLCELLHIEGKEKEHIFFA